MLPDWIDSLERRFEGWAVPNLGGMIVAFNAMVWLLTLFKPEFPALLTLDPGAILHGQVWRAFTFLFIPPSSSPIALFFWLYLLYTVAAALEDEWGEFRFNLYYGIGAGATVAAALLLGAGLPNAPLNATLFLAFAALFPEVELLLFLILPVKVRWLGWTVWAAMAWGILAGGWPMRLALLAALSNYAAFFGAHHREQFRLWRQVRRNRRRVRQGPKDRT